MSDLTSLSKHVVDIFKSTVEYNDYRVLLERLREDAGVYERVREFREKTFLIQQGNESDIIERTDALACEYDDVISSPLVNDFITAEAAFCKLVRDFTTSVTEELEFDI